MSGGVPQGSAHEATETGPLKTAGPAAPVTIAVPEQVSGFNAALLAEYTALKAEQTQRLVLRDNCFYVSITANAAIIAAYTQQQTPNPQTLLYIPLISTLLFFVYASNDGMITQIRRYIVTNIVPKLSDSSEQQSAAILGWEYLRRRRTIARILSKLSRLFAVWFTFSGASIVALIAAMPPLQDIGQNGLWLGAAFFTCLPYIFGLWLLDL